MARRRTASPFNLSFLDVMFCGFGAVVLLVLILDTNMVQARKETHADLRATALALEKRLAGERRRHSLTATQLTGIDDELEDTRQRQGDAETRLQRVITEIARMARQDADAGGRVEELQAQLSALESTTAQLRKQAESKPERGEKTRKFQGKGDRQYLTGLKVGGKRILILLDSSASMLDETLVNIIRLRNMGATERRRAKKWRRALATVEWLVANLPRTSLYQIYHFDVQAHPALPDHARQWLRADDLAGLDDAIAHLRKTLPEGGTSLYHAFEVVGQLKPRPDNILLITDGLPTQGKRRPTSTKVSAERRLEHFQAATRLIPKGVSVNSILLPMEGDAYAPAAFWKLAVATGGSFLTPAKDWP